MVLEEGTRVRVRHDLQNPRYGWGSGVPGMEGTVTDSRNGYLYCNFPGYCWQWRADFRELEILQ